MHFLTNQVSPPPYKKKSGINFSPGTTEYIPKSVIPLLIKTSSSMKKLPVNSLLGEVRMKFRSLLELTQQMGGSMPDQILEAFKSDQWDHHEAHSFSKGPYTTNPIKSNIYVKLFQELFQDKILKDENPIMDELKRLVEVPKYWREHQDEIPDKDWQTKQSFGDHHDWIIPQTFEKCKDIVIATGVNVYIKDPATGVLITGHIDLIVKIGNNIIICDYKPDLDMDLSTSNYGSVFIDSVPQLGVYGLIGERMFGEDLAKGYNLYCYAYNKEEGHLFEPLPALWAWREAYKTIIHPEDPYSLPWEFLIPENTHYDWWDNWIEKYEDDL